MTLHVMWVTLHALEVCMRSSVNILQQCSTKLHQVPDVLCVHLCIRPGTGASTTGLQHLHKLLHQLLQSLVLGGEVARLAESVHGQQALLHHHETVEAYQHSHVLAPA